MVRSYFVTAQGDRIKQYSYKARVQQLLQEFSEIPVFFFKMNSFLKFRKIEIKVVLSLKVNTSFYKLGAFNASTCLKKSLYSILFKYI